VRKQDGPTIADEIMTAAGYVNAGGTLAPGTPIGIMTFDADETFSNNTLGTSIAEAAELLVQQQVNGKIVLKVV
jgi:hypothetical protein